MDPLFPKKAKCRCNKNYHSTKDGRCVGKLSNITNIVNECSFCIHYPAEYVLVCFYYRHKLDLSSAARSIMFLVFAFIRKTLI